MMGHSNGMEYCGKLIGWVLSVSIDLLFLREERRNEYHGATQARLSICL